MFLFLSWSVYFIVQFLLVGKSDAESVLELSWGWMCSSKEVDNSSYISTESEKEKIHSHVNRIS